MTRSVQPPWKSSVPPNSDNVSFLLQPSFERHRGRHWLVVRLAVGSHIVWDMVPNPIASRSAISPLALTDLASKEGLSPTSNDRSLLHNLSIAGQSVPDLEVQVNPAIARLGVDGVLRIDFFAKFREVRWKPTTGEITLLVP